MFLSQWHSVGNSPGFVFKIKFPYQHLAELLAQAHTSHGYLLITWFSWLKVLGRHMSQCRTHRLADGQLLLWLQTLLCTPPSLLIESVCAAAAAGSVVKSTHCSSRGPKFSSPEPTLGSSLPPISPAPGDFTLFWTPHTCSIQKYSRWQTEIFLKRVCSAGLPETLPALESSSSDRTLLVKERLTNSANGKSGGCPGTSGQRQATRERWKLGSTTVKTQRHQHPLPKLWTE